MADAGGTATFTAGTGSKSFAIGSTPTRMDIQVGGTGYKHFNGYIRGTGQWCYPSADDSVTVNKAIQVKDNSGTVVLEGTWTGFSGGNANFNITTAPATMPQMLLTWGS